jgi:hypothetical protein
VAAAGVGGSGNGFSGASCGILKPKAEGWLADSRMADAPVAVTRHRKFTPANHPVPGFPLSFVSTGRDVIAITSGRDGTSERKPNKAKTRRLPASVPNGGDGNRRPA